MFDSSGKHIATVGLPARAGFESCFPNMDLLIREPSSRNPLSTFPVQVAEMVDRIAPVQRYSVRLRRVLPLGVNAGESWGLFRTLGGAAITTSGIVSGSGLHPTYAMYDHNGSPKMVVNWALKRQRITTELIEKRAKAGSDAARARAVRDTIRVSPELSAVPDYLPAYYELKVSSTGQVWVRDFSLIGLSSWWTIFAIDGSAIGRVEIPRVAGAHGLVDLVQVTSGSVVLRSKDSNGAWRVSIHAIQAKSTAHIEKRYS
jgi:hypothetical protein